MKSGKEKKKNISTEQYKKYKIDTYLIKQIHYNELNEFEQSLLDSCIKKMGMLSAKQTSALDKIIKKYFHSQ